MIYNVDIEKTDSRIRRIKLLCVMRPLKEEISTFFIYAFRTPRTFIQFWFLNVSLLELYSY
jgi:hypothetical protein